MSLAGSTILSQAEVPTSGDFARVLAQRGTIFEMSQAAENAVLRPQETGAFSHDLRAALAARMASAAHDDSLAAKYLADADTFADLADMAAKPPAEFATILTFVDKVANATRDVTADDVLSLQNAGISDPDIVRLCELIAFVAYQIRVIAGLRLMQGTAA